MSVSNFFQFGTESRSEQPSPNYGDRALPNESVSNALSELDFALSILHTTAQNTIDAAAAKQQALNAGHPEQARLGEAVAQVGVALHAGVPPQEPAASNLVPTDPYQHALHAVNEAHENRAAGRI